MNNKRLPKSNFELKQGISKRRLDLPSNCKDLIELINQDKITELPDVCLQLASVQNEYYDKLDPLKLIEKAKKLKSIREREKFFKNDQGDFVIKHPLIPIFLGDSCFERGAFSRANNFYKQGLKLEEEEVFGYDRELNKRIRKTTKLMMNPPNPFYATSMLIKECKRRISDKKDKLTDLLRNSISEKLEKVNYTKVFATIIALAVVAKGAQMAIHQEHYNYGKPSGIERKVNIKTDNKTPQGIKAETKKKEEERKRKADKERRKKFAEKEKREEQQRKRIAAEEKRKKEDKRKQDEAKNQTIVRRAKLTKEYDKKIKESKTLEEVLKYWEKLEKEINSDYDDSYVKDLARRYRNEKEIHKAKNIATQGKRLNPKDAVWKDLYEIITREIRGYNEIKEGDEHFKKEEYIYAFQQYKRVIELGVLYLETLPRVLRTGTLAGDKEYKKGNDEEAIKRYKETLKVVNIIEENSPKVSEELLGIDDIETKIKRSESRKKKIANYERRYKATTLTSLIIQCWEGIEKLNPNYNDKYFKKLAKIDFRNKDDIRKAKEIAIAGKRINKEDQEWKDIKGVIDKEITCYENLKKAKQCLAQGKYKDSIDYADIAFKTGVFSEVVKKQQAINHGRQGDEYLKIGNFDAALQHYNHSLSLFDSKKIKAKMQDTQTFKKEHEEKIIKQREERKRNEAEKKRIAEERKKEQKRLREEERKRQEEQARKQRPDLVITKIEQGKTKLISGKQSSLEVKIKNLGLSSSKEFQCKLYIDGYTKGNIKVEDLRSGEEKIIKYLFTVDLPGKRKCKLVVDPQNEVNELEEGNNFLEKELTWITETKMKEETQATKPTTKTTKKPIKPKKRTTTKPKPSKTTKKKLTRKQRLIKEQVDLAENSESLEAIIFSWKTIQTRYTNYDGQEFYDLINRKYRNKENLQQGLRLANVGVKLYSNDNDNKLDKWEKLRKNLHNEESVYANLELALSGDISNDYEGTLESLTELEKYGVLLDLIAEEKTKIYNILADAKYSDFEKIKEGDSLPKKIRAYKYKIRTLSEAISAYELSLNTHLNNEIKHKLNQIKKDKKDLEGRLKQDQITLNDEIKTLESTVRDAKSANDHKLLLDHLKHMKEYLGNEYDYKIFSSIAEEYIKEGELIKARDIVWGMHHQDEFATLYTDIELKIRTKITDALSKVDNYCVDTNFYEAYKLNKEIREYGLESYFEEHAIVQKIDLKEKELHEKANQEYDRIEKKFNQYRWNNDFEKAINAYAWMIRKLFYKNVDDYDNDYGLNKFKKMKLNFRRSVYRYINPELDNKLLQKLHNILDESIEQKNYAPGKISYNKIIFVGNLIWEYGGKVDKKEEAKEIYDISLSEFETDLKYYNMENAKEICELFECGLALKRDGETGKMSYWYLGRINAICGNKIKWEPGSSANQYYDESVKNFRKALEVENFDDLKEDEIRKKLRYNYENLGDWRFYNGHNEGAISDYEEAIRVMENKEDEDLKRKLTKARALQNILSLTLYRSYKNVDHLDYTDIDKYKQIYAKNSDKDEPYHSLEEALVTLGINELAKGGIDAAQNAEPYLLPLEQTWDYDFFDNLIEIYELNRSTYNKEAKAKYEEFVADDFKYFINRICGSDPLTIRASSNVDGINAHTISRRLRSWILDLR